MVIAVLGATGQLGSELLAVWGEDAGGLSRDRLDLQDPKTVDVVLDDELRPEFEKFWQTPFVDALDRMKLFRLAWDLVGSEFAGRHQQYEKFYAGASFIVRNHSFRETPWEELDNVAEGAMAHYDVPAKRD